MTVATVHTRSVQGVSAVPVMVEVTLGGGLPSMLIVGLAETSVKESRDRVKAAIKNSGYMFPPGKVVINLSPADIPKSGSRFDLPIALGILAVSEQIDASVLHAYEFVGELGLGGELRAVSGVLPTSLSVSQNASLLVPQANAAEAALCTATTVFGASTLEQVCNHVQGLQTLDRQTAILPQDHRLPENDLAQVKGQYQVKRVLEIAAAGAHNLLLSGPPGTGKSMLAMRMPGILPPMTERESTEAASIASVSTSGFDIRRWGLRPFRSPHHTSSGVALVGGGSPPRPGEISLAHHGVLFLDELTEFSRSVLDVLREPMETGSIMISRANWQSEFPARFQIVAAMNPCPCGYLGDEEVLCRCSPEQITRYQSKISGPFLDRIDLTVSVPRIKRSQLRSFAASGESSESVRQRVIKARACQLNRQGASNAELQSTALDKHCRLSEADSELLERSSERLQLSLRSHVRVIKIARTIADLAGVDDIAREHLLEALSYRTQMLAVRQ